MRREALHAVALEQDVAFLGVVEAADDVEGRGLARSVGADEPGDGPVGIRMDRSLTAVIPPKRMVTCCTSSSSPF